jgi:outer membrane protein assembly factor BamB
MAPAVLTPDRVLYIEDENVIALDRMTGQPVSNAAADDTPAGTVGSGKHLVAVGRRLIALDLRSGLVELGGRDGGDPWAAECPGLMLAPPAVHDGLIVVARGFEENHTHGGVFAFDADTGEPVWSVRDEQNQPCNALPQDDGTAESDWLVPGGTHAVIAAGRVWLTRTREHEDDLPHDQPWQSCELAGLNPASGEEEWTWRMPPLHFSNFAHAPAVADGKVFVTCDHSDTTPHTDPDGDPSTSSTTLFALRTDVAEVVWSLPLAQPPAGTPVIAGGLLLFVTHDGTVHAVDHRTGESRWSHDCGESMGPWPEFTEYEEYATRLVPGDGVLFLQTATSVHALR